MGVSLFAEDFGPASAPNAGRNSDDSKIGSDCSVATIVFSTVGGGLVLSAFLERLNDNFFERIGDFDEGLLIPVVTGGGLFWLD